MKKFFAALSVVLYCAVPLFADDVAAVRTVIVRQVEMKVKGDFAASFALLAPDYQGIDSEGDVTNREQARWICLALDGKHPEEFWLVIHSLKNNGAMPSPEQESEIRRMAHEPKYLKIYEEMLPQLVASERTSAEFELKTLKFIALKLDDDKAAAVLEYGNMDAVSGAVKFKIETVALRRIDGKWMICRSVVKNK